MYRDFGLVYRDFGLVYWDLRECLVCVRASRRVRVCMHACTCCVRAVCMGARERLQPIMFF